MSTTAKASDHVKPCNIEQSERHNRRDADYIASLNPRTLYVRTELSHNNESYVVPDLKHYDAIKAMVKQKTGRAMQEKKVTVIGKNGKPKERNGSSPIRESVVNIKPDTTMSDLQKYTGKVCQRWGVRAIQIHIHRDEGHYTNPDDPSTWQPNLHAHIIWDWMNHETGKSFKLGKKDMEELQDMAAETLDMERGQRKAETGREHLEHNDFILFQQKKQSAELDIEIAKKRDKLNTENGNAIKSGMANLFGKGKYADMEKENKRLKEELPKQKAALQRKYQQALEAERDRQSQQLAEKDKKIEELQAAAVRAVFDYIQDGYRSFSYRQECDVKRYMNSQSDKEEAAGTVFKASLPFLKSDECEKVKGQLSYIVQDMKEERQQSRSRGFHM